MPTTHFSYDNTNGYTSDQLARADALMDAWVGENPERDDSDWIQEYKHACERALFSVEAR